MPPRSILSFGFQSSAQVFFKPDPTKFAAMGSASKQAKRISFLIVQKMEAESTDFKVKG